MRNNESIRNISPQVKAAIIAGVFGLITIFVTFTLAKCGDEGLCDGIIRQVADINNKIKIVENRLSSNPEDSSLKASLITNRGRLDDLLVMCQKNNCPCGN